MSVNNPLDDAADAAMARLGAFQRQHATYLWCRGRPHPITGVVAPRRSVIDRELSRLVDAARQANRAAESFR